MHEAAGRTISPTNSGEAMVYCWKMLEYPLWIACELLPLAKSLKVNLMATNPTVNHKSTIIIIIQPLFDELGMTLILINFLTKSSFVYEWWENSAWDGQSVKCSISSNADFVTHNRGEEVAEPEGKASDSQFTKSSNPHLYSWAVGRERKTRDPWDRPVGQRRWWENGYLEHCA